MPSCPHVLAALLVFAIPLTATAQTVYRWTAGGTNTNWSTAVNWDPAGPPAVAATDVPVFNPFGGTITNPVFTNSPTVQGVVIAPNRVGGGWTFTQDAFQRTLTVGATGSTGLTTIGPATYTFNGPALAGASATNTLSLNVTNGSTLVLAGNSAVTANQGLVNVAGGTLRLDNAATNNATRLQNTGNIVVNGGGTLEFIGNAAGSATSLGILSRPDNGIGGTNTIRVTPNGAQAVITFANTDFTNWRGGTRNVLRFEATSGELGSATGAQIKFAGTPFTGTANLLSNASGAGTVGWGVVSDSLGVNYATYTAADGIVSVARAGSGATITTVNNTVTGILGTTNNQLNISNGTTVTASATVTAGSLRITPGTGGTLAMGSNALSTAAIMLDGANDFAITGTGVLGTGTHYFYVNNPSTMLSLQMAFTSGSNAAVFAGPGIVDLTGSALQNSGTSGNSYRVSIVGGVLRGNNTQLELTSAATRGVINLYGGVLEIKNGTNGGGTSADFTRSLGTTAGSVNWGVGNADQGSGGFSAFGSNASVNIGGAVTPTTLQWGQQNFVGNGYALKFGSTKSDSTLTWLNPIQLDASTQPVYVMREFNVTRSTGGVNDKTVLAGALTTSTGATADILKTGNGVLELTANNTFTGNTVIHNGELRVTGQTGTNSGTSSGNVLVMAGGILGGTGQALPGVGNQITVQNGGTIRGDSGTGTGTLGVGNTVVQSGGRLVVHHGSGTTASSLTMTPGSVLNLNTGAIIDPNGTIGGERVIANLASGDGLLVVGGTTYNSEATIATYTHVNGNAGLVAFGSLQLDVTGLGLTQGDQLVLSRNGSSQLVLTFTPVPEPASLLAVWRLVVGGVVGLRKLRRKAKPADVTPAA